MRKEYITSFSRRIGRKLSKEHQRLIESLLPQVLLTKERLKQLESKFSSIILEIGFGCGENIINAAVKNSDCLFIGCEPYMNGVAKVLSAIEAQGINNIIIFPDDVRIAIEMLPDGFLDSCYMLFPDPWPKRKQNKKRLFNDYLVELITPKLKKGGQIIFASDNLEYGNEVFELLNKKPFFNTKNIIGKDAGGDITTKYEAKARMKGIDIMRVHAEKLVIC
jgi:tRNA (guanine-N(7)-)-methyltransferase